MKRKEDYLVEVKRRMITELRQKGGRVSKMTHMMMLQREQNRSTRADQNYLLIISINPDVHLLLHF